MFQYRNWPRAQADKLNGREDKRELWAAGNAFKRGRRGGGGGWRKTSRARHAGGSSASLSVWSWKDWLPACCPKSAAPQIDYVLYVVGEIKKKKKKHKGICSCVTSVSQNINIHALKRLTVFRQHARWILDGPRLHLSRAGRRQGARKCVFNTPDENVLSFSPKARTDLCTDTKGKKKRKEKLRPEVKKQQERKFLISEFNQALVGLKTHVCTFSTSQLLLLVGERRLHKWSVFKVKTSSALCLNSSQESPNDLCGSEIHTDHPLISSHLRTHFQDQMSVLKEPLAFWPVMSALP